MQLIDTHVHFDDSYPDDKNIQRSLENNVCRWIAVGGDEKSNKCVLNAAIKYPQVISGVAIGMDRSVARKVFDINRIATKIESSFSEAKNRKIRVCAIGEIGMDYYYDSECKRAQIDLFDFQVDLAFKLNLPVIVHVRDAETDVMGILKRNVKNIKLANFYPGVIHSFTGEYEFAEQVLDMGFFISFSGILTFKNADRLRNTARKIPVDRMLIETDTPYLSPVPFRGKINEPAFLVKIAEKLAEIKKCSPEEIASATWNNAIKLFRLT